MSSAGTSSPGGNNNPSTLPTPPANAGSCDPNRPVVYASLTAIGELSIPRTRLLTASAGNKIIFVGGWHEGQNWWNEPVPVDIYNIATNSWSVHMLVPADPQQTHFRHGAAVGSLGNKIFIAGGGDGFGDNQASTVDIYNADTDTWSIQQLSSERQGVAAATVGNKILFAGGFGYPDGLNWSEFNTVDIYDNSTNAWSTATLSQARMDLTATTAGNKVYFAGGRGSTGVSATIDIYDAATNTWSVSSLQQPRTGMAGFAADGKIFWAGGVSVVGSTGFHANAEIIDQATGQGSTACIFPRSDFAIVRKNEHIVFFTGANGGDGDRFDIYNTNSGQWSTGILSQKIKGAAIISVNNTIYVAGGTVNGRYSGQVWRLEF